VRKSLTVCDLREAYPDMDGLSSRNLLFKRSFASADPDMQIVKQLVSLLPWGHVIRLLQRIKDPAIRHWYVAASIAHGWSRNILKPSIGLLLCRSKNKLVVEHALRNFKKPIGVAEWETRIAKKLPKNLRPACRRWRRDGYHFT